MQFHSDIVLTHIMWVYLRHDDVLKPALFSLQATGCLLHLHQEFTQFLALLNISLRTMDDPCSFIFISPHIYNSSNPCHFKIFLNC